MKIRIIVIIVLVLVFLGGFFHFEKKRGELTKELEKVRSEHIKIISKQTSIKELKKKRAEYFEKVFIINRPGDIGRSITALISVLILVDDRSIRFSEINIVSKTGVIEFEIKGFSRKGAYLLDFTDKLENSTRAFITSKTVNKKDPKQFIIRGEVAAE